MARKRLNIKKRIIAPDSLYYEYIVSKFINRLMKDGKKATAEKILYGAFERIKKITSKKPLLIFKKALKNAAPLVEVKSIRIGGTTYKVPIETFPNRQETLAIRWIIESSRNRSEKKMSERLALEIIDAYDKQGITIRKREELHKLAEANRAFSHYRW